MKCNMDFKFDMGAEVIVNKGIDELVMEGKITARIEAGVHPRYRIQIVNGNEYELEEKCLRIASCVPKWLRPGAEVQWMGEGPHARYVVQELSRGGRCRLGSFSAVREYFLQDGTPFGHERMVTECTPANMAFWRPWQEKKPKAKADGRKRSAPGKSG